MKTIYILVSGKGGVGKSVLGRGLVQYFREVANVETAALDIDLEKFGLSKLYNSSDMFEGCDTLAPNNKNEIVEKLELYWNTADEDNDSVLVLDTPGDLNSTLWKNVAMADVVDSFVDDGARVVIINLVNDAIECKQSIYEFPKMLGKKAEYVLAYSAKLEGKQIDDVELYKGKKTVIPFIVPTAIDWMNGEKYLFYSDTVKPRKAMSLKNFENELRQVIEGALI